METPFVEYIRSRLSDFASQNDLAAKAKLSSGQMSRLMNGKKPSVEECRRLGKALNIEPEALLKMAGELNTAPKWTADISELVEIYRQLDDKDKTEMLEVARLKSRRVKGELRGKHKV